MTMISTPLRNANKGLSVDSLDILDRDRTPFTASCASPKMSERYVFVDTEEVTRMMLAEGFTIAKIKSDKTRTADPRFVKHQIDFRHPDMPKVGDAVPRCLLTNSHNGSTKATMLAGVFREICTNGMIAGTISDSLRVRHVGDAARELIERAKAIAKNTAPLFAQIDQWKATDLSKNKQRLLAEEALLARFVYPERAVQYLPDDLLVPCRAEDEGSDLWTVFNRIQEHITHGGFMGVTGNERNLSAGRIESIKNDMTFNIEFWKVAAEMAK